MNARPAAIVTGGARGIGRACAEALAAAGFDIAVIDLSEDAPLAMPAGGEARFYAGDIAETGAHAHLVERIGRELGRIDCLVSNAGMGAVVRGDPLDLIPENFDRIVAVNLRGGIFFAQAVARWMLAHPAGDAVRSIIVITSISAEIVSLPRVDYCITKAGLAMWVKGLALRLAGDGIGVFDVRPGIIRTNMSAKVAPMYDQRIADGLVPANRWGEPEDVGAVVAALAGGAFRFSTGSVINVDGGLAVPKL
jgi:NAD(P)-dependent dehydrogenase (short-subunit alcohol dehydrogenase family)